MKNDIGSLGDLWGTIKKNNTCIMGVPGEEERKRQKAYLKKQWPKMSQSWQRKSTFGFKNPSGSQ